MHGQRARGMSPARSFSVFLFFFFFFFLLHGTVVTSMETSRWKTISSSLERCRDAAVPRRRIKPTILISSWLAGGFSKGGVFSPGRISRRKTPVRSRERCCQRLNSISHEISFPPARVRASSSYARTTAFHELCTTSREAKEQKRNRTSWNTDVC